MKRLWFKAKKYGWGWYPSSWQGWFVLAAFLVLHLANTLRFFETNPSDHDTLWYYIPETFVLVALLLFVCYQTGEKPGWRWGDKKSKE